MKTQSIIFYFIICTCIFLFPASDVTAVEPAPQISDREVIESLLMRLEAGIQANAVSIKVNRKMIGSMGTEMKSDMASLHRIIKQSRSSEHLNTENWFHEPEKV